LARWDEMRWDETRRGELRAAAQQVELQGQRQ